MTFLREGLFFEKGQSEPWETSGQRGRSRACWRPWRSRGVECPGRQRGKEVHRERGSNNESHPEPLMVFSSRCRLILRASPGEGPSGLERWQLESDPPSWGAGGGQARGTKPPLRFPEAKLLQTALRQGPRIITRKRSCWGDREGTRWGTKAKPARMARDQVEESVSLIIWSHWVNQLQNCPTFGLLVTWHNKLLCQ